MALQGLALAAIPLVQGEAAWLGTALALGLGTALVYPTLLAAVGDVAHPSWRASAVGVYRLWRDLGYAVGALLAGVVADIAGIPAAILTVAALTLLSSGVARARLRETLPRLRSASAQGTRRPRRDVVPCRSAAEETRHGHDTAGRGPGAQRGL
jgi:MFS family permease